MSEMSPLPFRTKICGVRSAEDVTAVVACGGGAIGLNFVPESPRYIDPNVAAAWDQTVIQAVTRVGVFVNQSEANIRRTADQVSLDVIQLHGDEPLSLIEQLAPLPVIRAIRCRDTSFQDVEKLLADTADLAVRPLAVLLDAYAPGAYGGTGKALDWNLVAESLSDCPLPVILAGGLRPENVAAAITTAHPAAVDTASGVEVKPGRKSHDMIRQFVANAEDAFAS